MKTVAIIADLAVAIAASVAAGLSWDLIDLLDNDRLVQPTVVLSIEATMGNLGVGKFGLTISDTEPSFTLIANPSPTSPWDQLGMAQVQLDGAYTAVTDAFYKAEGRKPERLAAVADVLEALGVVNLAAPADIGGGGVKGGGALGGGGAAVAVGP